jgi:chemotaxis protein methyltransferase CheR
LYQHAISVGDDTGLSRVSIIGSDIDRISLSAAHKAMYHATAFVGTPASVADRLFPLRGEQRAVLPAIQSMVRFERRDLLHEAAPDGIFDFVTCRNVVIYFDRPAQEGMFSKFYHALAPGGYLLLGRVETLFGETRSLFQPVDMRERIFRKAESL